MKGRSRQLFVPLICIFAIVQSLTAQEANADKPKQFIYVLRLVPRLYADSVWTREDDAVLKRHFARFQDATKSGQLILAGRTSESGDKTFGIAIFEAPDEDAARKFMQEDPAVAGGLMTAELHPFAVAMHLPRAVPSGDRHRRRGWGDVRAEPLVEDREGGNRPRPREDRAVVHRAAIGRGRAGKCRCLVYAERLLRVVTDRAGGRGGLQ